MDIAIIITYTLALLIIFMYSLAQLNLLFNYLKSRKQADTSPTFDFSKKEEIPHVTVQLPVFNELYVMDRLLDNIAELDYPKDKLEIQVLDDSTDESVITTAKHIEKLQQTGLDIKHICRKDRTGFKAGALKEGLKIAKGEFIAIFDADFLPGKNWLLQTIPYFKDQNIGVVQTRWGHINRDYSMLTKIQAFALDFHFTMEQVGRNYKDHFINFNGTAGVWRKTCIEDAGNWQGDTLTEDLDLSYRAQLKKWKFKYLEEVETPAELPVVISAARSQQFRWNKGAAENFQKLYWKMLRDKTVPFKTKFHSFFHLLNSSMFLLVLLVAVLSVPVMYIKNSNPLFSWYFNVIAFFALSTVIFFFCYWFTFKKIHGKGFWNFMEYIKMFFTFFSIAMGFSVHNSMAVLEGHFGKKSEFIRTPKFNINTLKDSWKGNKYVSKNISGNTIIEALLMGYFGFALYSAFKLQDFGLFLFHIMLFLGFGFVFFKSVTSKF
ncbi:cellulose synthase/poly-beta-1,6-N-acetylglucosamine synthase-like glycosyltransferase [Aquimarina sp. EL_43]|uniref:cellulose synthase family protein n=1 Tax=unclassified Aquimarina TaxID=2627091 RepID=UPI0018CBDB31|nr:MULTISPECIES: cellulose synthase family protein [unclassified Aquimarina]MBG6130460.1 cellulose synthase/poly-beta-1,6-N-acetylglucosamine synthase-like glycosyltransferase [Aquimarina sp. EL_35]MBG6149240.1 cellulose synthase/poly-beta-1,6-N-acetylglucosamine synthase-like glycosyltransferase [Aquimarina sp. EL_32]MBG6168386.1 cellulose synthase/poly-beta-1,6-N-acetylglucosamine synthase-like glycosyltransferase [Aquimarina sp. EL_43]